jgi:hypothetical protein
MLTLTEELFLLSLREKRGTISISHSALLPFGLAGAIIMELALAGMIRLDGDNKIIPVEKAEAELYQRLHEIMKIIRKSSKPRKLVHWIMVIAEKGRKLEKNLMKDLLSRGLLKQEEDRYFWVINQDDCAQSQASVKYYRKQDLRELVFFGKAANCQTIALLSLMQSTGLLENVFTPDEIIMANKRVQEIITDSSIGVEKIDLIEKISRAVVSASANTLV